MRTSLALRRDSWTFAWGATNRQWEITCRCNPDEPFPIYVIGFLQVNSEGTCDFRSVGHRPWEQGPEVWEFIRQAMSLLEDYLRDEAE